MVGAHEAGEHGRKRSIGASDDDAGDDEVLDQTVIARRNVRPVWELVPGTEAEELTKPLQAMGKRLEAALADTSPLSPEVRRAKAGIISRQVNL